MADRVRGLFVTGSGSVRCVTEVDDRAGILGKPVTENYIGALWHNRC